MIRKVAPGNLSDFLELHSWPRQGLVCGQHTFHSHFPACPQHLVNPYSNSLCICFPLRHCFCSDLHHHLDCHPENQEHPAPGEHHSLSHLFSSIPGKQSHWVCKEASMFVWIWPTEKDVLMKCVKDPFVSLYVFLPFHFSCGTLKTSCFWQKCGIWASKPWQYPTCNSQDQLTVVAKKHPLFNSSISTHFLVLGSEYPGSATWWFIDQVNRSGGGSYAFNRWLPTHPEVISLPNWKEAGDPEEPGSKVEGTSSCISHQLESSHRASPSCWACWKNEIWLNFQGRKGQVTSVTQVLSPGYTGKNPSIEWVWL